MIYGPYCGDGTTDEGEEACDDGNEIDDDECSNTCVACEGEVDSCGICNGGDASIDCNGDCGGDATIDNCMVCDADPTNDCLDNVGLSFQADSYYDDISWVLTDEDGTELDSGVGSEDAETIYHLLDDGTYCLEVTDAFGDGGLTGSINVDAEEVVEWYWGDYLATTEVCFDVMTACKAEGGPDAYYDACGACDADPENDCVADCEGTMGGTAAVDFCGTCDDDATNDCDCNEEVGGAASLDACGTCDADTTNDCTPNVTLISESYNYAYESSWALEDAQGNVIAEGAPSANYTTEEVSFELAEGYYCAVAKDSYGDGNYSLSVAWYDSVIGAAGGDFNWGSESRFCFTAGLDCAGVEGGDSVEDACGTCDNDPANDCDCAGTPAGTAYEDACGTCDDDATNDCDCAGTPGGDRVEDECGTCDSDPANDCTQDCAGTWGGDGVEDQCGTCDNDASNDCSPNVIVSITSDNYPNESTWTLTDADENVVSEGVPASGNATEEAGVFLDDGFYCITATDSYADGGVTVVVSVNGNAVATAGGASSGWGSEDKQCFYVGPDCAGVDGGTSVPDECGTCDDDASNDCVQDCADVWGGTATTDDCGTCDDDPANDCQPNVSLKTISTSYAYENSWELKDSDGNVIESGAPTGNYQEDTTQLLLADGSYCLVLKDSWGDGGMTAELSVNGDLMWTSAGGSYSTEEHCFDVAPPAAADCNDVAGGDATEDGCGTCDNDPSNDCEQDCSGEWGGAAIADECGNCDADATNDCTPNVTFQTTADNFAYESSWSLTLGAEPIAEGAPASSGDVDVFTWALEDGRYCLTVKDSYGDGGMTASLTINGTEDWSLSGSYSEEEYCFTIGNDCADVEGGEASEDMCGTCDDDDTNDCVQDCRGNWGGTEDDCGAVTVWLSCDENYADSRWRVFDSEDNTILDAGEPTEENQYSPLDWDLAPGDYGMCFYDAAASAGDGGCGGEARVNGEPVATWEKGDYTYSGCIYFSVPEEEVVDDGGDDGGDAE